MSAEPQTYAVPAGTVLAPSGAPGSVEGPLNGIITLPPYAAYIGLVG